MEKRAWCFLMGWVQVKPRAGEYPGGGAFRRTSGGGFPEKTAIQLINTTLVMGRGNPLLDGRHDDL